MADSLQTVTKQQQYSIKNNMIKRNFLVELPNLFRLPLSLQLK